MKKMFLVLVSMIISIVNLNAQEGLNDSKVKNLHNLQNSRWISKDDIRYTNYYEFKNHGSYIFYSGEREEYYPGIYYIKNDTLFLHEFYSDEDDPFCLLNREIKFIALLDETKFILLYREDQIRTKKGEIQWYKTNLGKPAYWKTEGE
jgi:hypothetical protein